MLFLEDTRYRKGKLFGAFSESSKKQDEVPKWQKNSKVGKPCGAWGNGCQPCPTLRLRLFLLLGTLASWTLPDRFALAQVNIQPCNQWSYLYGGQQTVSHKHEVHLWQPTKWGISATYKKFWFTSCFSETSLLRLEIYFHLQLPP